MALTPTSKCSCAAEIACLDTQIATLKENQDAINLRLCAVEGASTLFTSGLFAFMADQGLAGADQTAAAALVLGFGLPAGFVDGLFFGGDNNYPSGLAATIEANFAQFNALVTAGRVFPCMGNHDIDELDGQPLVDKFPLLFTDGATVPAERNYYHKYFANGDLDLYVLNEGEDTAGVLQEPDGNTVGSVQYNWFIDQLSQNTGRWRVVLIHKPHVTAVNTAPARFNLDIDWGFEALGIHLMLVGHNHANQHIRANGLNVLDVSAVSQPPRTLDITGTLYGDTTGAVTVFQDVSGPGDTGLPAVAKIIARPYTLEVELYELAGGTIIHNFIV